MKANWQKKSSTENFKSVIKLFFDFVQSCCYKFFFDLPYITDNSGQTRFSAAVADFTWHADVSLLPTCIGGTTHHAIECIKHHIQAQLEVKPADRMVEGKNNTVDSYDLYQTYKLHQM